MLKCISNTLNINKRRDNQAAKTILEDIKEKIKAVDKEIVEIETEIEREIEIETEGIVEIEDRDQRIEEEINARKIVDQDHNQEIPL